MVEDRDDSHAASGAPAGASRRLEACQSPVWDTALAMLALSDAGLAGEHPAMVSGRRLAARRGGHRSRATGRSRGPSCARGLGLRVRQRQLPRRRRHRRGGARARCRLRAAAANAAGTAAPPPAARGAIDGAVGRALSLGRGDAEPRRRLGRVRRRQHALARPRAAVPRLRRGDRRAERRRHRARASRCSRALGLERRAGRAAGVRWLIEQPGARRLVVRALGRQPRLRHRRGRARR